MGAFSPFQTRRVASADADAKVIAAKGEVEAAKIFAQGESDVARIKLESQLQISEIEKRTLHRVIVEEAWKQENIQSITEQAIPLLEKDSDASQMEDDWITNFYEKARIVSDTEMKALWTRVLAGEANAPGTFSRRTVSFIADLDKTDAEQFTALCRFCINTDVYLPLVFDTSASIYTSNGVTFSSLSHLESIGLISFNMVADFQIVSGSNQITFNYFDESIFLDSSNGTLNVGKVQLTKVGQQLAPLCLDEPVEGFSEYLKQNWREMLVTQTTISPGGDKISIPEGSGDISGQLVIDGGTIPANEDSTEDRPKASS